MKEILMTNEEIKDELDFEDVCGVNTLLQNLISLNDQKIEIEVFMKVDKIGDNCGYVIRNKKTGEDCQL